MELARILLAITGVSLVIVYAVGSGKHVTNSSDWYLALRRPWFQPPNFVFGLIWPFHFCALIAVNIDMALHAAVGDAVLSQLIFGFSIWTALRWSYLFYVPHELARAAKYLTITAAMTLPFEWLVFSHSPLRWWVAPYQVWLLLATCLSWSYAALNPASNN